MHLRSQKKAKGKMVKWKCALGMMGLQVFCSQSSRISEPEMLLYCHPHFSHFKRRKTGQKVTDTVPSLPPCHLLRLGERVSQPYLYFPALLFLQFLPQNEDEIIARDVLFSSQNGRQNTSGSPWLCAQPCLSLWLRKYSLHLYKECTHAYLKYKLRSTE